MIKNKGGEKMTKVEINKFAREIAEDGGQDEQALWNKVTSLRELFLLMKREAWDLSSALICLMEKLSGEKFKPEDFSDWDA